MTPSQHARAYADKGWSLIPIPAGKKGPATLAWNRTAISNPDQAAAYWEENPTHNMGLLHSASQTAAFDIDHVENTRIIFDTLGLDYQAILDSAPRIVGRADRGKVLFRVPDGVTLSTHKLSWPSQVHKLRTETVFELRAGAVQDVLPPSIHPDTQRPYAWAGRDWRDPLPIIPDQLLRLWTEWDTFRLQLMDICPWRIRIETQPKRRYRPTNDQSSVIDEFNRTADMHSLLCQYGYKPTRQNRYLSPNSTSGIAGVVLFDDGRAYSHHASDPFPNEHAFDAFDLYTYYDHRGDVSAAVASLSNGPREAPEPYDYDPEAIEHGRAVWASWQNQPEPSERAPLEGIPGHLLTVPGVLGQVVDWYNATAPRRQPQFAVQAALAFGATVMGRRWVTNKRNMTSLYFVNVAKSAAGKEHVKTVLEALLEKAGLTRYIGPSGYTSASGVFSGLIDQPNHITIIDELGRVLASSQASGNHHKQDAQTIIMEVFGRQMSTLRPQGFSKMGLNEKQAKSLDKVVSSPSLTIMSMTTPSTLYSNLSTAYVKDGFLGRFLIVESFIGRQVAQEVDWSDPPSRAIEWAVEHAEASGGTLGQDTYDCPPTPVLIPFAGDCRELLASCDADFIGLMDDHERYGLEAMFGRSKEIAMRLALIVARSKGEAEISAASLQWAIDYVTFYALRTVASLRRAMSDGPFEAACKAVLAAIEATGLKGMARHEIARSVGQFRNMEPRRREEVLRALEADEKVKLYEQKTAGRPKQIYRAVSEEE